MTSAVGPTPAGAGRGPSERQRRVKTPTVLQMEAAECGAAALAMVLAHHGLWLPLEGLRQTCGVSRDGSKASDIVDAARNYGLLAKGYKTEPDALRNLALPMIAFWNFNHFVVVEGFGRDKAYINDPARGHLVVSTEEFDRAFTGVVLVFEPGPDFVPAGQPHSLFRALRHRLPGSRLAMFYVAVATLALVILGLAVPLLSQVFLDRIVVGEQVDWGRPLLVLMAVAALLTGGLTYLQQSGLARLETRLTLASASRFVWHVLRLPMEFFGQRSSGEVGARIALNDQVARLLSGDLATNMVNVLMVGLFAALMLQYDVLLTMISVAVAGCNLVALRYMARRRSEESQMLLQQRGTLAGVTMNGLQTIETLKATGGEADFFATWAGHHANAANAAQLLSVSSLKLGAISTFLTALAGAMVLCLGGLRVIDGVLTLGMLLAFQQLLGRFLGPVNGLVTLGAQLQEVSSDLHRLDDVIRYPVDPQVDRQLDVRVTERTAARLQGELELRDVTYGYNPLDPPLLTNFSVKLHPGRRVALVGASGSGKSTIAKLVCGLYTPWSGEILFDGRPFAEVSRKVMTYSVAMVDQDIALFEGTIRDNLTMWDESVAEPELIQAARDARIHDDITNRPGGYDAVVEEGGRNFSGGQRQRLEIARALVRQPRLLILDEATSALDPLTEQRIDDSLRRRGCTCLIVAHRLSTIRDCDEILVLQQGQVVQRGTHETLRHLPGAYAGLIRAGQ